MKTMKQIFIAILLFTAFSLSLSSCEKDKHIPPSLTLKTGSGYTSADVSVAKNQTITVGITADKMEDDMLTCNVSYSYDAVASTTTFQNFSLSGAEQQHYEKDVMITARNLAGTEKWFFTITDKESTDATIPGQWAALDDRDRQHGR